MVHPQLVEGTNKIRFKPVVALPIEELGKASMVIGEILYNLRAALDYIVYATACANNKAKHVGGTQFPIETDPDVFEGRVTGKNPKTGESVKQYLRKVPPSALERIRQLQPFSGCAWTPLLRDLSNPDKHRGLNALSSQAEWIDEGTNATASDGRLILNIEGHFEVEVIFTAAGAAGADVTDTLDLFEREIRATVQLFKRAFYPVKGSSV